MKTLGNGKRKLIIFYHVHYKPLKKNEVSGKKKRNKIIKRDNSKTLLSERLSALFSEVLKNTFAFNFFDAPNLSISYTKSKCF